MSVITDLLGISITKKRKKANSKKPIPNKKAIDLEAFDKLKKLNEKNKLPIKVAPAKKHPEEIAEDLELEKEVKKSSWKNANGLTPRELKFIKYHLLCLDKKDAAIHAGYSKRSAPQIASVLLRKPHVKKEINSRIKKIVGRTNDKISKMIEHLTLNCFFNPLDVIDENGALRGNKEDLGELAFLIDGIETKPNNKGVEYTTVKLLSKTKAREQLGKYLQMFSDKIEVTGGLTLNIGKPPETNPVAESASDEEKTD